MKKIEAPKPPAHEYTIFGRETKASKQRSDEYQAYLKGYLDGIQRARNLYGRK